MRVSESFRQMRLLWLGEPKDGSVLLQITAAEYRSLLLDHAELCRRVAELEVRLAAATPPPPAG